MATFSQGFLSQLANPAMSQSLFDLGSAIGGLPGQRREQQQKQAFNQLMQQIQGAQASGDFNRMKILGQQLAAMEPAKEAKVMQAATALEQQQKAIQAGSGMFSEKPEQARESAEQLAKLGRFSEAGQALTRAESLEQKEQEVGRKRTSAQMLMSEIQQVMKTPNISKADKEKALGLLREAAQAGEDSDLLKPRVEELKKSLLPKKVGSRASPTFRTLFNEEKGMNYDYALYRGEDGKIVQEEIGPSKVEKSKTEEEVDLGLDTKWGSEFLKEARTKAQEAATNAANYNQLATEASKRTFFERGVTGKALSATEEALGIAGAATLHRRRINEIRMSKALSLLPAGPASDRDVQLALDASIDPNNLEDEQAEAYLRGMAKIAEAEEEYYSKKAQFIQYTKDPNAVGFEDWVAKTQAQKTMDFYMDRVPDSVASVKEKISLANRQVNPADREAALRALEQDEVIKPILDALENQSLSEERWEQTVLRNKKLRGLQ